MESQERRRDERYQLMSDIDWKLEANSECLAGGHLINISRSGVCITVLGNLPVSKGDLFNFTLKHAGQRIIKAKGTVHWIRHSSITNNLYVGFRFDQPISEFDKKTAEVKLQEDFTGAAA
tara:strand:+ start:93516 stop:93875 length:360 start_codon:yes stop_codon:yes gene_type:complete